MPELTLSRVQEWARMPGSTQVTLIAERHYVRLKREEAPTPLYIQEGHVFSDIGSPPIPVDALPAWFWVALRDDVTPEALRTAGWQGPTANPFRAGEGPDDEEDERESDEEGDEADEEPDAVGSPGLPRTAGGRFAPRS